MSPENNTAETQAWESAGQLLDRAFPNTDPAMYAVYDEEARSGRGVPFSLYGTPVNRRELMPPQDTNQLTEAN